MANHKAADSTDQSIEYIIYDVATGLPKTGITYDQAGASCQYRRGPVGALTDITLASLAAVTTAHSDGGFIELRDGLYRTDLPDAVQASGVAYSEFLWSATGYAAIPEKIYLDLLSSTGVQAAAAAAITAFGPPTLAQLTSALTAIKGATWDSGDTLENIIANQATISGLIGALNDITVADILNTAMTESYAADGAAPTLAQALFQLLSYGYEFEISGDTLTAKKLDGSTTAMTFTLAPAGGPYTSCTRTG